MWYFLYGRDVGELNIYTVNSSFDQAVLLSKTSGDQGFLWQQLELDITSAFEFRIFIEGVVSWALHLFFFIYVLFDLKHSHVKIGKGYLGDIAIDDLEFANSSCRAPTTTSTTTLQTYPFSSIDCNFDSLNICQWSDDTTSDFYWSLNNGSTASILTGPVADHTTDSSLGHYIYLEASPPRKFNDAARLTSPFISMDKTTGGCFKVNLILKY